VQSGLSSSIRSLEHELGAELFVRTTRGVRLSDAGRALLPEARRVLAAAASARDAVDAVQGLVRGAVAIGTPPAGFLPRREALDVPAALRHFSAEHPDVEIRLRQAATGVLVEDVSEGALDFALVALPGHVPQGVRVTTIAVEPIVLACDAHHRLAERRSVSLADLQDEVFVDFPEDWGLRLAIDRAFASLSIERRSAFIVNDLATLLGVVSEGLAVALLPRPLTESVPRVRFVSLRKPAPIWELALIVPIDGRLSRAPRPGGPAPPLRSRHAVQARDLPPPGCSSRAEISRRWLPRGWASRRRRRARTSATRWTGSVHTRAPRRSRSR
jgi:DNA-binding transcriptional LysR family regulator